MSGQNLQSEPLRPESVKEACVSFSRYKDDAKAIAGGTDMMVLMKSGQITPRCVIDIKTIPDLDYIHYVEGKDLRIGALATIEDIANSPIIQEMFPVLASAAQQVGSPQIRNMATIGGNLGRAAPSADMAPALIGLGAKVKTAGLGEERVIDIGKFFLGPGKTALRSDEMLTEIRVPNPSPHTAGVYLKAPAGKAISIATVGVAVVVTLDAKHAKIVAAKIVLGAVAPIPIRATKAEGIIKDKAIGDRLIEEVAQAAAEEAKPITDIRGSAGYRREMVKVLVSRAIKQAVAAIR